MFANSSMKQMYIYFIKMWNSENKRLQDLCVLSQKKLTLHYYTLYNTLYTLTFQYLDLNDIKHFTWTILPGGFAF